MVGMRTLIILLAGATAAAAQDAPRGNWQTPGAIQVPGQIQVPGAIQTPGQIQAPRGTMQAPGEIQKAGEIQKPGEIQQPKGPWITPGEIQQPKGPWIKPGEIQVPKGIQAVHVVTNGCENRLSVLADALFDFDKANLRPDAEATLREALPEISQGGRPRRARRRPHRRQGHRRLQHEAVGSARPHRARLARRQRRDPGLDPDQGLRQADADRAQHHDRRARRSRGPAEEPARRDRVRDLQELKPVSPLVYPAGSGRGGAASALAVGSGAAFGPPLATATSAGRSMRSPIM